MKTLAMLKMEKNFIAHIEKGYPRKPYAKLSLEYLTNRFVDEGLELIAALEAGDLGAIALECADVSNIVDYIFEKIQTEEEEVKIE